MLPAVAVGIELLALLVEEEDEEEGEEAENKACKRCRKRVREGCGDTCCVVSFSLEDWEEAAAARAITSSKRRMLPLVLPVLPLLLLGPRVCGRCVRGERERDGSVYMR